MQFRNLPSVDSVLANQDVAAAAESFDRGWVVDLIRDALESARGQIRQGGDSPDSSDVARSVCQQIEDTMRAEPRQVINATGVVIHTNLGRAPLSQAAMEAANQAARGYKMGLGQWKGQTLKNTLVNPPWSSVSPISLV